MLHSLFTIADWQTYEASRLAKVAEQEADFQRAMEIMRARKRDGVKPDAPIGVPVVAKPKRKAKTKGPINRGSAVRFGGTVGQWAIVK